MDKPPIGIIPKEIWERKRLSDISEAIIRYFKAGLPIPTEWKTEFENLFEKYVFKKEGD